MGYINQLIYIEKYADDFEGPYLEVGSKDYGNTQDLRSVFAGRGQYTGVDMETGPGVDAVCDMAGDFEILHSDLGQARFGTIFCLSVLEHCENPFIMADNLTRLLKPGGKICISVPFSWKFHGYPSDYWRFTHEGIKKLFSGLSFDIRQGVAATSKIGELLPIDEELGRIPFSFSYHKKRGHPVRGIFAKCLNLLSRIGIFSWVAGYRYVMAPVNIFMIGVLKSGQ